MPFYLESILRGLIIAALVYAALVALTHWAVRARKITPFGAWPRFVRRISDPVLKPLERRVIRVGGSPQDAPLWLFGIVVIGGLLVIAFVRWAIGFGYGVAAMAQAGPMVWLIQVVNWIFRLLMLALLIRVIASWFGISPYKKWMRPVVWLTDWIIEPVRRVLPTFGPLDLSPLVAYLILMVARWAIMQVIVQVAG